jgi:serine phosphatase RsbU (regulator of sigma subunit)
MTDDGLFVTLFHARLDPASGVVRYVDAGHGYCAIRRPSGELVSLQRCSLPLGIRDNQVYHECVARLEPGDALVVYSDGLVETEEGTAHLSDYLAGLSGQASATELMSSLIEKTPATPPDDVTIVVLRRRPEEKDRVHLIPSGSSAAMAGSASP